MLEYVAISKRTLAGNTGLAVALTLSGVYQVPERCTVLYCTVLYCTAMYCTVLYCTVLYCTVLYCTVLRSCR